MKQWPRNRSVYFTRFWTYVFTGRPEKALAMIDDEPSRPTGVAVEDYTLYRVTAEAFVTTSPADVEDALRRNAAAASGQHSASTATPSARRAIAAARASPCASSKSAKVAVTSTDALSTGKSPTRERKSAPTLRAAADHRQVPSTISKLPARPSGDAARNCGFATLPDGVLGNSS